MFFSEMLHHAGPSSLGFFAKCLKIITVCDLQIKNYKIEVQLKPKLNQLWRIALWLGKLQLSVFLKIVWVFWLECVVHALVNNSFWISFTVFGLFCYCHFVIKSRAPCRPKSRCQSDLSTVSVLTNKNLHQDLMHSRCCGTAVPNVVYRPFRFSLSLVPRSTKGLFTG